MAKSRLKAGSPLWDNGIEGDWLALLRVVLMALLLIGLLQAGSVACGPDPPPPPDCYDDDDCDSCEECINGECVCNEECCSSSDCGACEDCFGCTCLCMAECGCGDKTCSDCKECVDCECQLKPGNTCVSDLDCPRCYDCVNCNCQNRCTSDQCCNESTATCVDKCTNTGECDWGEFLHAPYAECLNMDPFIKSCAPGVEGALCKHRIIYYATDAECAPCAPGCSKTRVDHCAEITPGYCRTHCILMVCNCSCDLKPEEAWRQGDHYTCGE